MKKRTGKIKTLKTDIPFPLDDQGREAWLRNFAGKLPLFSGKYNISEQDVEDIKISSYHFSFWQQLEIQLEHMLHKVSVYKTDLCMGMPEDGVGQFIQPVIQTPMSYPVANVTAGFFLRLEKVVRSILNHPSLNLRDAYALGIVAKAAPRNTEVLQPVIDLSTDREGHPQIMWDKSQADELEILVDRGAGYSLLARVSSGFAKDYAPLPYGTTVTWKYKGIYRSNNKQVGLWSSEMSVIVGREI